MTTVPPTDTRVPEGPRPAWRDLPAEDRERIARAVVRALAAAWRKHEKREGER